jgi:hypothetical protein
MPASSAERLVYDIAIERLPFHRGRKVIVRARSPAAVVSACRMTTDADVLCVQLQGLPVDVAALAEWGYAVPIEFTMSDPGAEFPALYRYARLVETHLVRVVVPVRPGFSRAVKLAASLHMAAKLDVGQPVPAEIDELAAVLDFYLHQPSCAADRVLPRRAARPLRGQADHAVGNPGGGSRARASHRRRRRREDLPGRGCVAGW